MIGQFQYMLPAVGSGLAIGMIQSELTYFRGQHTWLPSAGLAEIVPLVLVLVVLVVRAKPLPSRGVIILQTLGRACAGAIAAHPAWPFHRCRRSAALVAWYATSDEGVRTAHPPA